MATPRVLVVPGGTSAGAAALANASLHKLVELHEERQADPSHPAPRTIVVLRDPDQVPPSTLRGAAVPPSEAFPADEYPDIAPHVDDPGFFDGIDLVIPTSGSSAGSPRLVGISTDALVASAKATEAALSGPGRWILALPTHHIAGAMVLVPTPRSSTAPTASTPATCCPLSKAPPGTGPPATWRSCPPSSPRAWTPGTRSSPP